METEEISIIKLYKKYIKDTPAKTAVKNITVLLCNLTKAVELGGKFHTRKIYLKTRVLKHLYDGKPAEEFDFIINNLFFIVKYPDQIYKNKDSKRGEICLIKNLSGQKYFCSIETSDELDSSNIKMNYIVTAFRIRKESYLNDYKLLWSWKGDLSSS
jgi:hypothetical protein